MTDPSSPPETLNRNDPADIHRAAQRRTAHRVFVLLAAGLCTPMGHGTGFDSIESGRPSFAGGREVVAEAEPEETDDPLTDQIIVHLSSEASRRRIQSLAATVSGIQSALQQQGLRPLDSRPLATGARVFTLDRWLPASQWHALGQRLAAQDDRILSIEPDLLLQAQATPNDPRYAEQWHYFEAKAGLKLPAAWDLSTGQGAVVAVLDTGVRPHADLADNLVAGYDFVSSTSMGNDGDGRDNNAIDPGDGCNGQRSSWHGTHVAGTIAAVSNNSIGVAGVAWNARILPVRVLGCGGGYTSDIADGILWAAGAPVAGAGTNPNPARVLNLSLGGAGACGSTSQNAINTARSLGATVVVAAGNSNQAVANFTPANCQGVVTVAAVGRGGARAPYSNFGPQVDLAAPGGNMNGGAQHGILSTLNAGASTPGADSYAFYQGTSMATPHVAGVAALMVARNPALTPDEVEALLKSAVRPFPVACGGCGTGLADAAKAVRSVFLSASSATDVNELEPNNTHATAQWLDTLPVKVAGTLAGNTDADIYRLPVAAGATVKVRLIGNALSNYDLQLRTAQGAILATSSRPTGLADNLSWTNKGRTLAGLHIRVHRVSGGTGDSLGRYTLEASN